MATNEIGEMHTSLHETTNFAVGSRHGSISVGLSKQDALQSPINRGCLTFKETESRRAAAFSFIQMGTAVQQIELQYSVNFPVRHPVCEKVGDKENVGLLT